MKNKRLFLLSAFLVIIGTLKAQNPIITDQFTADPTAKVLKARCMSILHMTFRAPSSV